MARFNPLFTEVDLLKGSWRLGHWRGVPILAHWSLLLFLPWLLITRLNVWFALLGAVTSIFIMLVHELGHAAIAKWRGVKVLEIDLLLFHGRCLHKLPYDEADDVWIAWGGVLAQAALAALVFFLWPLLVLYCSPRLVPWLYPAYWALTISNLYIAAFNLFPIPPLDGAKAWRLIPLLQEWWRERRAEQRWQRRKAVVDLEKDEERARKTVENILDKMRRGGD